MTVVQVDLDMADVSEGQEENPGDFIPLNDDDDDEDGVIDYEDYDNAQENDFVEISLQVLPETLTGPVTLKANSGGTKIRVWEGITWGSEVVLPKVYATPGDVPECLYAEGIAASGNARDVELVLEYMVNGNTIEDRIKVTVVDVDVTATSLFGQVTEKDEEYPNGVFIHFNLDNDDSSSNVPEGPKHPGADYAQTGTTPVTNENDLQLILPYLTPLLSEGVVMLTNTSQGKL
jgi:hypothetical protein